ncbi:CBN-SSP-36 protein [Caenorhabditis brenneri]|uniref:CBN-SSP-36 protein n=1 Tax=Caenorhabditis brenneri TaxID=135651 RepID=G0MGF1_CAEBE|nr:CBN-SSP-36 protein [Caenorhabditis brenneri]
MNLTVEPAMATFPATGGTSVHFIVSTVDSRVAFKVKSSNNDNYRVRPVYGFVETKGRAKIEILRLEGPVKDDKLIIQWAEVPADEIEPQAPFKAGARQGEVTILMRAS